MSVPILSAVVAIFVVFLGTTLISGVLAYSIFSRMMGRLVCFSIGALLTTALLHLLPEAIEMAESFSPHGHPPIVMVIFLLGILLFFLMERFSLSHHHHEIHHAHSDLHHEDKPKKNTSSWKKISLVAWSYTVHGVSDGVLIVSAFYADLYLGWLAALSIAAHEIPNRLGMFAILMDKGLTKRQVFFQSMLTCIGPLFGALLVFVLSDTVQSYLFLILSVAASHFVYIAMSDLIPKVQQKSDKSMVWGDISLMVLGGALVVISSLFASGHA
jgi:zinc and cadmium transporter